MNSRERWLACMNFQPVDHVPDVEFGYWEETFPIWHAQGLPKYIDNIPKADIYFGFEQADGFPFNGDLMPGFEYKVISEDDRHRTILDYDGATKVINKDGASSIPHYLKFPIETRADWNEFKKRLDWTDPTRMPSAEDFEMHVQRLEKSTVPVMTGAGSLFGRLRDWMGFENIAMACMDDPIWIEEMIEYCTEFYYQLLKQIVTRVKFDYAAFWEDMAFNHGPIISPTMFAKWLTPRYKRITDLLRENGCMFSIVDCDGNINVVYKLWLEGGVNCMFPLEVRGGTDAFMMRRECGKDIKLIGGVDKTRLIAGKEEIDKELERIRPMVEEGGFIPHVDHRCPPDVTFENYKYYLKRKREVFGIPEPTPWEERKAAFEWAE